VSAALTRLRELERLVAAPIDLEQEARRAARRRFVLDRGRVRRVPIVGGASISTSAPPVEPIYSNASAGTAKNTFTTEAQINDAAGMGSVAQLNSTALWGAGQNAPKATLNFLARGLISSTATPTFQWFFRFGTSSAGALVAGTAALTTLTTITNQIWEAEFSVQPVTLAAAGANSTFRGLGLLSSPGGLAAPGVYNLWGGAATPGTVATVDWSIVNSIWVAVACSASSASNGITLLQLIILGA
jgi:hypothetical protein